MILLLDIGNTCMKWAFLGADGLEQAGAVVRADKDFKDLAKGSWAGWEPPERVLVCNVAGPTLKKSLTLWTKRHWKVAPEFIQSEAEACGVRNAYHEPRKLGSDRWAALIGARQLVAGPACVIDCGTAITIDALAADGRHLGGLIIPGLALMAHALIERAPDIHVPSPANTGDVALFARDTDNAITGGALYAAVALLDRAIADVVAELGTGVAVIMTGGDGERIAQLLRHPARVEPELVLRGAGPPGGGSVRYLIYLLVIANLAFWAWYPAPPEPMPRDRALSLPPGVETLVLLRERGQDPKPAETDPSLVPEPEASEVPGDDAPLEEPPPEPEPVAVEEPVDRCYSIGPFMAAEEQAAAATTLRRAGLEVKPRSSDVQEPIGYWVYLPAMASEEARRVAAELTRQGVSDYFIGKQNYISLGAFSAKPAAEERRRQIAALGYEPRLDPRFRTRTAFWLDVLESAAAPVPEERWAEIQARYPEAWRQSLSCE